MFWRLRTKKTYEIQRTNKRQGYDNIVYNKNGYKTYLVDEFRTSCKCSKCDGGIVISLWLEKTLNHSEIIVV